MVIPDSEEPRRRWCGLLGWTPSAEQVGVRQDRSATDERVGMASEEEHPIEDLRPVAIQR
jgi:hypothetical protein